MREADRPVLALDDMRGERGIERAMRNAGLRKLSFGWDPDRRYEPERLARCRRELVQPHANEPLERLRHRERLERIYVAGEGAGDLERKERVCARSLMDAEQRLARERSAEPIA